MYKKIKRKDIYKYYKCPICFKIVRSDNRYHEKKCKYTVNVLLDEIKKGAETNDTEH